MYYELKVESRSEDGKIVKDTFIVEDESTVSAEKGMYSYLEEKGYSDFEVVQITKRKYSDIILRGMFSADTPG